MADISLQSIVASQAARDRLAAMVEGVRLTNDRLDFAPLLSFLADCDDPGFGAALFHATVAWGLAQWVGAAAQRSGWSTVACGGGCAMNVVLMAALRNHLAAAGVELLEARRAPPNDGGLALGQAWVARCGEKEKI